MHECVGGAGTSMVGTVTGASRGRKCGNAEMRRLTRMFVWWCGGVVVCCQLCVTALDERPQARIRINAAQLRHELENQQDFGAQCKRGKGVYRRSHLNVAQTAAWPRRRSDARGLRRVFV